MEVVIDDEVNSKPRSDAGAGEGAGGGGKESGQKQADCVPPAIWIQYWTLVLRLVGRCATRPALAVLCAST